MIGVVLAILWLGLVFAGTDDNFQPHSFVLALFLIGLPVAAILLSLGSVPVVLR